MIRHVTNIAEHFLCFITELSKKNFAQNETYLKQKKRMYICVKNIKAPIKIKR